MIALDVALALLALPVLAAAGYLALLAVVARRPAEPQPAPAPPARPVRFDVVVPAHDEEAGIGATVRSVLAVDYPAELRRVLVVADNCTDATAARAEDAGAAVLVRHDETRRGKGYALEQAFARVEADDLADAVVVVDADTIVSPNLLSAFARRIGAGASAVQAEYGVRNPDASWRTRLLVIALALFHVARSLGRERLGLSVGLRGNGMAWTRDVMRRVPYRAYSLVEDVEHTLALGEAGVRVELAAEAQVLGEMASSGPGARTQRVRWERGRAALARRWAPRLLAGAWRRRDRVLLDLALDLVVPPLATLVATSLLGTGLSTLRLAATGATAPAIAACSAWSLGLASLVVYVVCGARAAGIRGRGLAALAWAPLYVAWKLGLAVRGAARGKPGWIRTAREGGRP